MNPIRLTTISALLAVTACALASATDAPSISATDHLDLYQVGSIVPKPSFGVRVGVGNWNSTILSGGLDVTFKIPVLPLPELRLDGEAWGEPSSFSNYHGNALSLVEMQSFAMGYVGVGPSYFFSDKNGEHHSGFAAKVIAGVNLPDSAFVEASIIMGATPSPIILSIGKRF